MNLVHGDTWPCRDPSLIQSTNRAPVLGMVTTHTNPAVAVHPTVAVRRCSNRPTMVCPQRYRPPRFFANPGRHPALIQFLYVEERSKVHAVNREKCSLFAVELSRRDTPNRHQM